MHAPERRRDSELIRRKPPLSRVEGRNIVNFQEMLPDPGGIFKGCPLLGGAICPDVVSRVVPERRRELALGRVVSPQEGPRENDRVRALLSSKR